MFFWHLTLWCAAGKAVAVISDPLIDMFLELVNAGDVVEVGKRPYPPTESHCFVNGVCAAR